MMVITKKRELVLILFMLLYMGSSNLGCGTTSRVRVQKEEKGEVVEMVEAVRQEEVGAVPSVTLEWDASSDTDTAGYKIYYGTSSRSYDTIMDVGNYTSVTIGNLDGNQDYYFAVTAYDSDGNESAYSDEVFYRPDTDDDGMADAWELLYFGNLARDGTSDSDSDGLTDLVESEYGTDPHSLDSDGDGFKDADEVEMGTDPNDPNSHPRRVMPWIPLLLVD